MSEIIEIDLSSDSEPESSASQTSTSTPNSLPNSSGSSINQVKNSPMLTKALSNLSVSPKQYSLKKGKNEKESVKKLKGELKKLGQVYGQFDPEKSNRERRKLMKKINGESEKTGHDGKGLLYGTLEKIDLCDCLDQCCPGCFLPCRSCRSPKCGVECRNDRRWIVESVENEANHTIVRNQWI